MNDISQEIQLLACVIFSCDVVVTNATRTYFVNPSVDIVYYVTIELLIVKLIQ